MIRGIIPAVEFQHSIALIALQRNALDEIHFT